MDGAALEARPANRMNTTCRIRIRATIRSGLQISQSVGRDTAKWQSSAKDQAVYAFRIHDLPSTTVLKTNNLM
jgi:hypothetical protein